MGLAPESPAAASVEGFVLTARADVTPRDDDRGPASSDWQLIPIVGASGFAGLGYEMVWTRELSLALGTEMMAVLGAVAGFFGGLALGAFALDRPVRQAKSPRLAYALLESVIGLWGFISVWLLPGAGRVLPPLLGTEPAPALLWAASFALPALVMLPATMAMGGTLTALERMMREVRNDSHVTAGVFGANTAGAVAGTLFSAFFLLPVLGLSGTLLCLAGLNALCALGALAFGPTSAQVSANADDAQSYVLGGLRLILTLFATGLLGIAFEVLVIRLAGPLRGQRQQRLNQRPFLVRRIACIAKPTAHIFRSGDLGPHLVTPS
jgi:spermidine synthase